MKPTLSLQDVVRLANDTPSPLVGEGGGEGVQCFVAALVVTLSPTLPRQGGGGVRDSAITRQ